MSELEPTQPQADEPEAGTASAARVSPGECLKQARQQAGLSPEQVAKNLHLDTQIIRAIEVDRFQDVGAPVYAKGYLRTYAKLVGVTEEEVLASYDALQGTSRTAEPVPVVVHAASEPPRMLPGWVPWAVIALVALIGMITWWNLREDSPAPAVATEAPVTNTERATSSVEMSAATETPLAMAAASAAQQSATEAAPVTKSPTATNTGPVTMQLRFTGDSWVEVYDATNKTLVYDMGTPTVPHDVSGTPPWRVMLGSANAVQVIINGQIRELPANKVRANVSRFVVNAAGDIE